jgi:hypothetical protein
MNFFAEFEFFGLYDNLYWLPLWFEASSIDDANDSVERIATGIRKNYRLAREPQPTRVINKWISERFIDYCAKKATGKVQILNVTEWKMRSINPPADVTFSEATRDQIQALLGDCRLMYPEATVATGNPFRVGVQIIETGKPCIDECLLIDVVLPQSETGSLAKIYGR